MSTVTREEITQKIREVHDHISYWLAETTGQNFQQDEWSYEKGEGGGVTRIWEADEKNPSFPIENGGVNFSGIKGGALPEYVQNFKRLYQC